MFTLYDTLTGQAGQIAMPPRGLLRMFLSWPPQHRRIHIGDLRTFLLADLIRRNAEHRHDLTVVATLVIPDDGGGSDAESHAHDDTLRADTSALNVRAAEQTAASAMADPVTSREIIVGAHRVATGPVLFSGREVADAGMDAALPVYVPDLADRGIDPLALRLAYLSVRYREQADLSWNALTDANHELRRWRERVAQWAESPSKPMCAQVSAQVAAAFDDDMDSPAAVAALRGLEQDPEVPPGSKFESFMHADQILSLDLPREIGRA